MCCDSGPMTRRTFSLRHRVVLLLSIWTSIVSCDSGSASDCLIGPCTAGGGDGRSLVIAGFPSARAFSGVGRLAPGDTFTLHAIRIGPGDEPCVGPDTARVNVQWGVSNSTAAAFTPLSDGGVRVRALAQGNFQMLMREGATGAPSVDS